MVAKNRRKKKEEQPMDMITADAENPQVIATDVTVPKSKPKKRVRTPRNDLSVKPKQIMNFKAWFTNLIDRDKRFKEHHYDQIRLYMKGLGLSENDEFSKYETAISRYFGG